MITQELYEKLYGVKTNKIENPITDTVAASPEVTPLLLPDPGRLNYTLFNLGSTVLYLAFTPDPSPTKGVYVSANGGYFSLDWKEDGILVCYPLYGISSGEVKVFLVGLKIFGD